MASDDRSRDDVPAGEPNAEEHQEGQGRAAPAENDRQDRVSRRESVSRDVLPLAEEQLTVDRRQVETGRVRVSTKVGVRKEDIEVDLTKEEVDVRRVPVGREVEGPVEIRQVDDVTIVPVLEEVVVVRKQLILREEVHIRRRSSSRSERHEVDLRYEEPLIERLPADDDE